MRVGQPRVHRHGRDLDEQPDRDQPEHEGRLGDGSGGRKDTVDGGLPRLEHGHQDADEHERAAREGEYEELHRCMATTFVSPHPDEEVHRDEHRFPEDVEQDDVGGEEDAGDRALQSKQKRVVRRLLVANAPRRQHGDRAEQRGECKKRRAQPVDPQRPERERLLRQRRPGDRGARESAVGCERDEHSRERERRHQREYPWHAGTSAPDE